MKKILPLNPDHITDGDGYWKIKCPYCGGWFQVHNHSNIAYAIRNNRQTEFVHGKSRGVNCELVICAANPMTIAALRYNLKEMNIETDWFDR